MGNPEADLTFAGSMQVSGDSGLLVVRSLLEAGVGVLAAHLDDPRSLADQLVAAVRDHLRASGRARVRRIPTTAAAIKGLQPVDGAVVGVLADPSDRRLAQLLDRQGVPAVVVVPDAGWLAEGGIPCLDPPPTVDGFRVAVRLATRAAAATAGPVGVVLRRSLAEGFFSFVSQPLSGQVPVAHSAEQHVSIHDILPPYLEAPAGTRRIIVASACWEPVLERLLRGIDVARLIVPMPAVPDASRIADALADMEEVLLVAETPGPLRRAVVAATPADADFRFVQAQLDLGERQLANAIAAYVPEVADLRPADVRDERIQAIGARLRNRSAASSATLPASVVLGVTLAQPALGLPAPSGTSGDSWRTGSGLVLRIAAERHVGAVVDEAIDEDAVPFLAVVSCAGDDQAQAVAARLGEAATFEFVSTAQPRAIGAAIARAARTGQLAKTHVVMVVPGAGLTTAGLPPGVDPDLLAAEPAVWSAIDPASNPLGLAEVSPAVVSVAYEAPRSRLAPGRLGVAVARTLRGRAS